VVDRFLFGVAGIPFFTEGNSFSRILFLFKQKGQSLIRNSFQGVKMDFETTCVDFTDRDCEELERFEETAEEITYDQAIGYGADLELFFGHIYKDWGSLKDDWHVQYWRGDWYDRPAVIVIHSGIEHVFV